MFRLHAILLMLGVAACGSGNGGGGDPVAPPINPPPGPTPPPQTATVNMLSSVDIYGEGTHSFAPPSVTVAQNGSVTWSNNSGVVHNVTFGGTAGAPANVPDMGAGTAQRQFTSTGTFSYTCTNHPGMNGSIVVQ